MKQAHLNRSIRFGYGPRSDDDRLETDQDRLTGLLRPDPIERRYASLSTSDRLQLNKDLRRARRDLRKSGSTPPRAQALKRAKQAIGAQLAEDFRNALLYPLASRASFRERMVAFWADHFTVEDKNPPLALFARDMVATAIRPNLAGSFSDMLVAVSTHPAMVIYLDQSASAGPNSMAGQRRARGLNENLAREILELHTLGVGAQYSQRDVRQFAELLTGVSVDRDGFVFRPNLAEPGAERVLGQRYGGAEGRLEDVLAALDDLARRPETAAHIARKLAVHFVAPKPEQALVDHIAARFRGTDGNLAAVCEALLEHPAAHTPPGAKVRRPQEYVVATMRALGVRANQFAGLDQRDLRRQFARPLTRMGQRPLRPGGPDGWPEEPAAWITPATLAARLEWAKFAAVRGAHRFDPRDLTARVLGDLADEQLNFAISAAPSREDGLTLLLASPAFNRR